MAAIVWAPEDNNDYDELQQQKLDMKCTEHP